MVSYRTHFRPREEESQAECGLPASRGLAQVAWRALNAVGDCGKKAVDRLNVCTRCNFARRSGISAGGKSKVDSRYCRSRKVGAQTIYLPRGGRKYSAELRHPALCAAATPHRHCRTGIFGGPVANRPGGNRTPNRRFWRPVLYQLSYGPTTSCRRALLHHFERGWLTGIEPATPGATDRCSNRLSYSHHEQPDPANCGLLTTTAS